MRVHRLKLRSPLQCHCRLAVLSKRGVSEAHAVPGAIDTGLEGRGLAEGFQRLPGPAELFQDIAVIEIRHRIPGFGPQYRPEMQIGILVTGEGSERIREPVLRAIEAGPRTK